MKSKFEKLINIHIWKNLKDEISKMNFERWNLKNERLTESDVWFSVNGMNHWNEINLDEMLRNALAVT